jgi:hypothetical protein
MPGSFGSVTSGIAKANDMLTGIDPIFYRRVKFSASRNNRADRAIAFEAGMEPLGDDLVSQSKHFEPQMWSEPLFWDTRHRHTVLTGERMWQNDVNGAASRATSSKPF